MHEVGFEELCMRFECLFAIHLAFLTLTCAQSSHDSFRIFITAQANFAPRKVGAGESVHALSSVPWITR